VNTLNVHGKNFTWSTRINFTLPRTKLISYPHLDNQSNNYNYIIGKPITGIKLYQFAGVNPATGNPTFYNAEGREVEYSSMQTPFPLVPAKDRIAFIDRAPKFYGGMLNAFTYKSLSLDFLMDVVRRMGPNYLAYQSSPIGSYSRNLPSGIADRRWKRPGDITNIPKASSTFESSLNQQAFANSTGAYSDATYARLENLSIAYHFSDRLIRRLSMSALSIYVAGQNLCTISKYKDFDPESMGFNHLPPLQTYVFGLNITF